MQDLSRQLELYRDALIQINREADPSKWAALQSELGSCLAQIPLGNRADNLEEAIVCYQTSLEVRTREAMPLEWSRTMSNLANAYMYRIRGERAENLEHAIECSRLALEVRTRQAAPVDWARLMSNLGFAYYERIHGDRAENLEQAIVCYQQSLEIRTKESTPVDWALTTSNLALAYTDRIQGERAENFECAINGFQQSLEIITREEMPIQWAQAISNLALAFHHRIRGERAENIETAIFYFQQSLAIITREEMPVEWAQIVHNLAFTYSERIYGEKADNLEMALLGYQQALTIRTRTALPIEWAITMMNMGNAFASRVNADRAENLENAIACYQQALEVITRESLPVDWAQLLTNLGITYAHRIKGERAESLEQAITTFRRALEIRTRQAMPNEWANTMLNLANAYVFRINGTRSDNLEAAIVCYRQALTVAQAHSLPSDHQLIQRNLGYLYLGLRRWHEAYESYSAAIAAGAMLLESAFSETGRRAEIAETSRLFAYAAYCLIQLGRPSDALVQLEAGKTRVMSEVLALADVPHQSLSASQREALQAFQKAIRELETEMRSSPDIPARRSDRDLAELLRQVRQELNQLVAEIRKAQPDFVPIGLTLPEIISLVAGGEVLVTPIVTLQGSAVFVVPHGIETVTEEHVIRLDTFNEQWLNALLVGDEDKPGWLRSYTASVGQNWSAEIERIMRQVWDLFIAPVHQHLAESGVKRIILMPSGGLQLLPLHAAWREVNGAKRYWLDDYEIRYAPSAYALRASQRRAAHLNTDNVTALVAGVSQYQCQSPLPFTRTEVEEVSQLLHTTALIDQAATASAVREQASGATYLHLSCHGSFAWGKDPLSSALYLANDEPLTLAEVIGKLDLKSTRLVTLSACETGITDVRQSPDEYIGLPAGFMQAGAAGVVSSLWSVNDLSTALLMITFYGFYLEGDKASNLGPMHPAEALRRAQLWLRNLTNSALAELFDSYRQRTSDQPHAGITVELAQKFYREYTLATPDMNPYKSPYYWAPFVFYGT